MPRPNFDADLIAALRSRVIAHNQKPGVRPVKLQELRKAYASGYRGKTPDVAAMAKVDGLLAGLAPGELAKATGDFNEAEHPRDSSGQFTEAGSAAPAPKPAAIALRLPASQQDHRDLTANNAGYAALQAAVIPETRYSATGRFLRDAGSLAAGVGLAVSLARGKPNGVAARLARGAGGATGKLAAGIGAGLVNQSAVGVTSLVRHLMGNDTPGLRIMRNAAARARTVRAGRIGHAVGQAAGEKAFQGASRVVRGLGNVAAAGGETPLRAKVRRAAMTAAIGVPIGLTARDLIQGGWFDPEQIGSGIDAFSVRRVQKLLDNEDLAKAHDVMLDVLRKGGDFPELRKAIPRLSGMYSTVGRGVLSGLAGVAGAAVGGAAGAGAQRAARAIGNHRRGNPYHDEHGRFTSSSNARGGGWGWGATLGAITGAAAGGLGVYAALRGHNAGMIRAVIQKVDRDYARRVAGIRRGGYGAGIAQKLNELAAHKANRDTLIDAAVRAHPGYQAAVSSLERFGASATLPLRARMNKEVNDHIGVIASGQDEFKILTGSGKAAKWQTIAEIKAGLSPRLRETEAARRAADFAASATPEQFATAIEGIKSAEQKKTLRYFFDKRAGFVSDIDQAVSKHHAKIYAAEKKLADAKAAVEAAGRAENDARAIVDRTPSGQLEARRAAESTHETAALATSRASEAEAKAQAALLKLKDAGPEIESPVTGRPLPKPSSLDQRVVIEEAASAARKHAEKVVDAKQRRLENEIEKLRQPQIERTGRRVDDQIAALAQMAKHRGIPKGARDPMNALLKARVELAAANRKLADAVREAKPKAELDALRGEVTAAERAKATAATAFKTAALNPQTRSIFHILPDGLREDLTHDLKMATATVRGAAKALLERPTMQRLVNFVEEKAAQAKRVGIDVAHRLFFVPDGKGGWTPNWLTTTGVGIPTAAIAGAVAGEVYASGKDAVIGAPEAKAKARARLKRALTIEQERDAITGATYAALTAPHPTDKGDRVILYGEHQGGFNQTPKMLATGGRISKVRTAYREGKLNEKGDGDAGHDGQGRLHTGRMAEMAGDASKKAREAVQKIRESKSLVETDIPDAGGVRVSYLRNGQDAHGGAGPVIDHLRKKYFTQGVSGPESPDYFGALKALFSNEAQVLTARQRYRMLTNRNENGGRADRGQHGIFTESETAFNSNDHDKIVSSLTAEIDRALKANPSGDDLANLHRAVHIVGVEKGVSDKLKPIHQKIAAAAGLQAGGGAAASPTGTTSGASVRSQLNAAPAPADWDKKDLRELADAHATRVRRSLGPGAPHQHDIATLLTHFAHAVHRSHGLDMQEAITAAGNTLYSYAGNTAEMKQSVSYHIISGDAETDKALVEELDRQAEKVRRSRVAKMVDLDDLDALMKGYWDAAEHPRIPTGPGGGEFTAGAGATAAGAAGYRPSRAPGLDDVVMSVHGQGEEDQPPPRRNRFVQKVGELHPVSVGSLAASNAGYEGGVVLARKALGNTSIGKIAAQWTAPTVSAVRGAIGGIEGAGLKETALSIAEKFLPGPAQVAAKLAIGGATQIAGIVASGLAGAGAETAIRTGYAAAGKRLGPTGEENAPVGRMLAGMAGTLLGSPLGAAVGAVGGPVGAFAGGAAGSTAGQLAGARIYDWFTGYSSDHTSKVMQRFMSPGGARA